MVGLVVLVLSTGMDFNLFRKVFQILFSSLIYNDIKIDFYYIGITILHVSQINIEVMN